MATIELSKLTRGDVRNLSGQERGLAARHEFKVDELDKSPEPVLVQVPGDLDTISPSFFRGMFSVSILTLGIVGFSNHYVFDAKPQILEQVEQVVKGTIRDRSQILS
ncbi:hypothetical protein [Brevundimonas sp.]|uniref:hypothetical protein n=1 Tax=Brevundimonas sp. TaxID=1871086 RepID=UPI003D0AA760